MPQLTQVTAGGPLINADGEVIGINSVKITSAEGIGFAVPINSVKKVIESFSQTGRFEEATLGIFAYDKSVIPYIDSNAKFENGIYVAKVTSKSTAARSGIKEGDIIISIDGKELNRMCELRCYIYSQKPNNKVTLKLLRNNREMEIQLTLDKKL